MTLATTNRSRRRIVFLTGTRADFGKLKPLISETHALSEFEVHIFATGMHLNRKYGRTVDEIKKSGFPNIFMFHNHENYSGMDTILSRTVEGFSQYVQDLQPDLIVLHGDRVEALAGAIVGILNNVLTAHVEGGELSGTVDDSIRHAVSKLCHIHFTSNEAAKKRLLQMGEHPDHVFVIGSPDIDLILSDKLPTLATVTRYYDIPFKKYSLLIFHPVTTEQDLLGEHIRQVVDAALECSENFVVLYPNNDLGSELIFEEYKRIKDHPRFKIFPSLRFEYFLVLLQNARMILGNSSAGIMEAPYYGTPTVNIGSRQQRRTSNPDILNCPPEKEEILRSINTAIGQRFAPTAPFGHGNAAEAFAKILKEEALWATSRQKRFSEHP